MSTMRQTFTAIKAEHGDESAQNQLMRMINVVRGETGASFKECRDRVFRLEPELHVAYLNAPGER